MSVVPAGKFLMLVRGLLESLQKGWLVDYVGNVNTLLLLCNA